MHARASWVVVCLLLAPALAHGEDFEALKARAERVDSLGSFLSAYVGACKGDPAERRDCERNVRSHRKGVSGKLLYVRLSDRHSRLVQLAGEGPGGSVRLALTPLFDAGGYGLSRGKPLGVDRRGNPRMRLLPLRVVPPDGMDLRSLELALRTGNVRLELVFVAQKPWRLKRRGDGDAEGVAARFRGLRLTSARTGEVIGEATW